MEEHDNQEEKEQLDKFPFFRSYLESIEELPDEHTKCETLMLMIHYGLDGEERKSDDPLANAIFKANRFILLKSRSISITNRKNGRKGGGQIGNNNASKSNTTEETSENERNSTE